MALIHYNRSKSQTSDLKILFNKTIKVENIAVFPLLTCNYDDDAEVVKSKMRKESYDIFPVRKNDKIIGYIDMTLIGQGICEEYCNKISRDQYIKRRDSFQKLLSKLKRHPWLIVRAEIGNEGIVTRGDLQKVPMRLFIFGTVTIIEMQMTELIKKYYSNIDLKQFLKEPRIILATNYQRAMMEKAEELDVIECLQFCDKREIITKGNEILEALGKTRNELVKVLEIAEKLRNKVAHANNFPGGKNWIVVIEELENLGILLDDFEELLIE